MTASAIATGDLAVDHTLSQIATSFRFILDVTPVDAVEWQREILAGAAVEPQFHYRDLEADPAVVTAMLDGVALDAVADPTLAHLFRAKHDEIALQVKMLRARETPDFRTLSIQLYGGVDQDLREQATAILDHVAARRGHGDLVRAPELLALALDEIERYRAVDPDVEMHAEIRDDVTGVLCEGATLLIGREATVAAGRANALIQHEIGTHLVTKVNGDRQPLKVLGSGLAGYDETQEGLAVLAEIAVGGLTSSRLRQLAARVLTVDRMVSGASFLDCHAALTDAGFAAKSAFTTTMRVFRSGGLTKDVVYLRGLVELLVHLRDGGSLDRLWLGKFSLRDLPLVDDLVDRDLLAPATVLPTWLTDPASTARLSAAASVKLIDLLEGAP